MNQKDSGYESVNMTSDEMYMKNFCRHSISMEVSVII